MIRMKVMTQTPDWTEQTTPDTSHTGRRLFSPRVDIYEVADGLVLLADLPGVDESAVEVTVENQVRDHHRQRSAAAAGGGGCRPVARLRGRFSASCRAWRRRGSG